MTLLKSYSFPRCTPSRELPFTPRPWRIAHASKHQRCRTGIDHELSHEQTHRLLAVGAPTHYRDAAASDANAAERGHEPCTAAIDTGEAAHTLPHVLATCLRQNQHTNHNHSRLFASFFIFDFWGPKRTCNVVLLVVVGEWHGVQCSCGPALMPALLVVVTSTLVFLPQEVHLLVAV